ncbi:MAG: hypothetical protein KA175_07525 [Flavobacteriales bacterium]|nr:hypothetical protein [Flavobacteriales bacterium]MBP6697451.1 hypothetical protein [Flavobacteriales bacterium]
MLAQYGGGNGRGDAAVSYQPTLIASNIFSSGNGRGDAAVSYQPTPLSSSSFSGGNGRGDGAASHQPAPIASSIFSGGDGRGDVAASHQPTPIASSIFSGGNGRGDVAMTFIPPSLNVMIALRAVLEGPYNSNTGLMGDALRIFQVIPANEPYTALGYVHVGGGGESVAPQVLETTLSNAIVDWVVVELRSAATPATVLGSQCALIQRDGDVVTTDGISPVTFALQGANYHVALRHRNHLGVMTLSPIALSATPAGVDFSLASTMTYGTNARKSLTGTFPAQALWAGDVTFNKQLKYAGSSNDRDPILVAIGGTVPTNTLSLVYRQEDITMNGVVKYAGSGNDRDILLQNIGGSVPTATRNAQLP